MRETHMTRGQLAKIALSRLLALLVALGLLLFLPAGTFNYWQAWVYIFVLFVPVIFVGTWLLRNDPALFERRMHTREREAPQRLVILLSFVWFVAVFVLSALDWRLGWSHMPTAIVIAADVLIFASYLFVASVLKENSYASRVVEVDQQQKVISSGPYAIVRHPMYSGTIVMYGLSPVALGSWWAVIPAVLIIPILVVRILNEEAVLLKQLTGYAEYAQRVRWRLLPGVW